jgi:hypothetical protein
MSIEPGFVNPVRMLRAGRRLDQVICLALTASRRLPQLYTDLQAEPRMTPEEAWRRQRRSGSISGEGSGDAGACLARGHKTTAARATSYNFSVELVPAPLSLEMSPEEA